MNLGLCYEFAKLLYNAVCHERFVKGFKKLLFVFLKTEQEIIEDAVLVKVWVQEIIILSTVWYIFIVIMWLDVIKDSFV